VSSPEGYNPENSVGWWQPALFTAMAGGMGWGIRGQYGHETGAMIAGVLVSFTLVFLLCPRAASLQTVRAIALGTIAMGFGGSMTYGQTVGLTHDAPLVGHWGALCWGMAGLAIKGGIWIGFAGFFLGLGLGGKQYRLRDMCILVSAMLLAVPIGWWLLNTPHDPENMRLPFFYFSDHWCWEPEILGKTKHRPEIWGGLLFALIAAVLYATVAKKDVLARNMALWGILGGALGFPGGQCVQAMNAWNPGFYRMGLLASIADYVNWWNAMETTFGAIMGAVLGFGLWLNRARIDLAAHPEERTMPCWAEMVLLVIHLFLLIAVEFWAVGWVDALYDFGIAMAVIPLIATVRGRMWPYLQVLPITLLPIAGKTLHALAYQAQDPIGEVPGWIVYFILPMVIAVAYSVWSAWKLRQGQLQRSFIRNGLLFATWTYFWLNYAFFGFPWPWKEWGGRTPHGLVFAVCAMGLTIMVFLPRHHRVSSPHGFHPSS